MSNFDLTSTDLEQLFDKIQEQRNANNNTVTLDDSLLDSDLLNIIQQYCGQNPLIIKNTTVNFIDDTIALSGTVDSLWDQTNQTVRIFFKAQEDFGASEDLLFILKSSIEENWYLSSAIPDFYLSVYRSLPLTQSNLVVASDGYFDTEVNQQMQKGLNITSEYTVNEEYPPLNNLLPANTSFALNGYVQYQENQYRISLRAAQGVDIPIQLISVNDFSSNDSILLLDNRYNTDTSSYEDRIRLIGTAGINDATMRCTLENLSTDNEWDISFGFTGNNDPDKQDLISMLHITNILELFPAVLVTLTDVEISEYGFAFDAWENNDTRIILELDYDQVWDQVPILNAIQNVKTELGIQRFQYDESTTNTGYTAVVRGTITIGSTPVNLIFNVGAPSSWLLRIQPQGEFGMPGISDILNLMGNVNIDSSVPGDMNSSAMLTVNTIDIGLDITNFTFNYTYTDFTVNGQWEILPNLLALENVDLKIRVDDPLGSPELTGTFKGSIILKTGNNPEDNIDIPIQAGKEAVALGWYLLIAQDTTVPVPGVPSLLNLVGAGDLIDYLPDVITTLDGFVLSDIEFRFSPLDNSLERFHFFVGQDKDAQVKWSIIPDKLSVSDIAVNLTLDNPATNGVNPYGYIEGNINILSTKVPVQASKDTSISGWEIKIGSNTIVELPSVEEVFDAFNASSYFALLPDAIQNFPRIWFSNIDILFKPDSSGLKSTSFELGTSDDWPILPDYGLIVGRVYAGIQMDLSVEPTATTGSIRGSLSLWDYQVLIEAERSKASDPWMLHLKQGQNIHVPNGLKALADWMLPTNMVALIPDFLMPFPEGFDFTKLDIDFDLTNNNLKLLDFSVQNSAPWQVIKNFVSFDKALVSGAMTSFSPLTLNKASIQGDFTIASVPFHFSADKSSPTALWELKAGLTEAPTIRFQDVLTTFSFSENYQIPFGQYGLPSAVTIDQADVKAKPEIGEFTFAGKTSWDWTIPFGFTNLVMDKLDGNLKIYAGVLKADSFKTETITEADSAEILTSLKSNHWVSSEGYVIDLMMEEPEGANFDLPEKFRTEAILTSVLTTATTAYNTQNYLANLAVKFQMAGINTDLQLQLGTEVNTVLTATLTSIEAAQANLGDLGTTLTTDGTPATTENEWANQPIPENFDKTTFEPNGMLTAKIIYDLSAQKFIFWGQSKNFGEASFLSMKLNKTIAKWMFIGLDVPADGDTPASKIDSEQSELIWKELKDAGFIDNDGNLQSSFNPSQPGFKLNLPDFENIDSEIVAALQKVQDQDDWGYFAAIGLASDFRFANLDSDLSIIDDYIKIDAASFAYSSFSADSVQDLTKDIPQFAQSITFGTGNPDQTPVKIGRGVNLFGQLSFETALFSSIEKILAPGEGTPFVSVYAYIAQDVNETLFQATLGNLTLLGALRFDFVQLTYKVATQTEFSLCGKLTILVGDQSIPFFGNYNVNDSRAQFFMQIGGEIDPCSIAGATPQPQVINAPLGMQGINIQTPQLFSIARYKDESGNDLPETQTQMRISGGVEFFSPPENEGDQPTVALAVAGEIIFDGSTARVVDVELKDTQGNPAVLDIGAFLNTIFGVVDWSFLDIQFRGGGVYYVDCPDNAGTCSFPVTGDKTFHNGFTANTEIDIYGFDFGIEVQVLTGDKSGIRIAGFPASPMDFGFIQLSGSTPDGNGGITFDKSRGPELSASNISDETKFGLEFGVTLLQQDMLAGELDYNVSRKLFEGTTTYTGPLAIDGLNTLSFEWSEDGGFKITNWPLQDTLPEGVMDWAKWMEEVSKSDGDCGELVGLVFDDLINTRFTVSADQLTLVKSADTNFNGKLEFQVTGTYHVDIGPTQASMVKDVIAADTPTMTMTIPLPKSFDLANIAQVFVAMVLENAKNIVAAVMADPAQFTKFIAAVSAANFSGEVISALFCRDVESENLQEPSEEYVEDTMPEAEDAVGEATELAGEVGGAGTAGTAAGTAAAAEAAADVGLGLLGTLAGVAGGLLAFFGIGGSLAAIAAQREKAEKAKEDAQKAMREKLKLNSVSFTYQGDNAIQVSWSEISGGGITYEYQVKVDGDVIASSSSESHTSITITDDKIVPGAQIDVKVRAKTSGSSDGKTYWYYGDWKETSSQIVSQPTVTQVYNANQSGVLDVSFTRIEHADHYEVKVVLIDKNNEVIYTNQQVPQGSDETLHTLINPFDFTGTNGGQAQAWVRSVNGNNKSDWGKANDSITRLGQVPIVSQQFFNETDKLKVEWTRQSLALQHYLEIINTSTNDTVVAQLVVNEVSDVDPGSTASYSFTVAEFTNTDPGELTFRVRAVGATAMASAQNQSSSTITRLSAPDSLTATLDKAQHTINTQWPSNEQTGLASYQLLTFDTQVSSKTPLFTQTVGILSPLPATMDSSLNYTSFLTKTQRTLQMKVFAIGAEGVIYSGETTATDTFKMLAEATSITQTFNDQDQSLTVSWAPVSDVAQYKVDVIDPSAPETPVATSTFTPEPNQHSHQFVSSDFASPLNGVYQSRVQAIATTDVIDSGVSVGEYFAVPALVNPIPELTFIDGQIKANWQDSDSRVTSFKLQLFKGNTAIGEQVSTSDLNYSWVIDSPLEGDQYTVKVRVLTEYLETAYTDGASITLHILSPVTDLTGGSDGNSVVAKWESPYHDKQFRVRVIAPEGASPANVEGISNENQILIANTQLPTGNNYQLEVRVQQDNSFSPATTLTPFTIQAFTAHTFYLPQAFTEENEMMLGNGAPENWGNSYSFLQAIQIENAQSATVGVVLNNQTITNSPWFPFAFKIQNLIKPNGWQSGDLVVFKGFDAQLNDTLISSIDGANGPFTWELSADGSLTDLQQVFKLMKWESNDGGGNAQFGTGPIQAGDYVMLLRIDHQQVNTSMDSGPEAIVWTFDIDDSGKVLQLEDPKNIQWVLDDNQLKASLDPIRHADVYKMSVNDLLDGNKQITTQTTNTNEYNFPLSIATQPDRAMYVVNIKGVNAQLNIGSDALASPTPILQLGRTDITSAVVEGTDLHVMWSTVADAHMYVISVVENTDVRASGPDPRGLTLDVSSLTKGQTYHVQAIAQGDAGVIPGKPGQTVAFVVPTETPDEVAQRLHESGKTSTEAASEIQSKFSLNATNLTMALAHGGYDIPETTTALQAEFPDLPVDQFVAAMQAAFPEDNPEHMAQQCHDQGKTGAIAAQQIVDNFPWIDATELAVSMAQAGYEETDVTLGLKAVFPDLPVEEFVQAETTAFPPTSMQEFATNKKKKNKPALNCAQGLQKNYPGVSPDQLTLVMQRADYDQTETTSAAMKVYPHYDKQTLSKAIMKAYSG